MELKWIEPDQLPVVYYATSNPPAPNPPVQYAVVDPNDTHHYHVRGYHGRDPARWTRRVASTPSLGSLVYAGGQYPISIAKTAVDSAGNTYTIGGWISLPILNGTAANGQSVKLLRDVFVSKIDRSGSIVYVTWLGGRGDNVGIGIAVDSAGNVWGVGSTTSPDFPLVHPIQTSTSTYFTEQTGFVFKLDSSGALVWSTYFGGSGIVLNGSIVDAVAVDGAGNAYVTGATSAANFPATPGAFQTVGNVSNQALSPAASAFVAKISPSGALIYATWLQGSRPNCIGGSFCEGYLRVDAGTAIAVDSGGSAYVAGATNSTDFPVTSGAFQATCNCPHSTVSPFVAKLNADGSGLVYATYLGSLGTSSMIVLDASGDAYVTGSTRSNQFPTTAGVLDPQAGVEADVFVSALNPLGTGLLLSTYLGGSGNDAPTGLAIDANGDIFLSGTTDSPDFPDSYGMFSSGPSFLAELTPGATQIMYSMRLPQGVADQDVELDPSSGEIIAAGSSGYVMRLPGLSAASLPPILGVGNAAKGGVDNALSPGELVSIYGSRLGPATAVTAQPTVGQYPDSLAGVHISFNNEAASLTYASSTRIDAAESASLVFAQPVVTVKVFNNATLIGQITLPQVANMLGIFRNGAGTTPLNQDGSVNSASNPAKSGSTVSIWATGAAGYDDSSGQVSTTAQNFYYATSPLQLLTNNGPWLNGFPQVTYAGRALGLISAIFQVDFQLPPDLSFTGPLSIRLSAGGIPSPAVPIYVAP
jgi:uncharacterized protein (TIGR03437 family)